MFIGEDINILFILDGKDINILNILTTLHMLLNIRSLRNND